MRRTFILLGSWALVAAIGCDGGGPQGQTDALVAACESYCAASFKEPCGELNLTEAQCKAACAYYPTQLQGVCEAEATAAFQCIAEGGVECLGYDTDGDGTDDTFLPTPKSACVSEQQAQATCEQKAGCPRFCKVAEKEGCGDGCLAACEDRAASLDDGATCSFAYQAYMTCGAREGASCEGGKPVPDADCADDAFSVGECVSQGDLCGAYCFAAEELGCGANCAADCAAKTADATCGSSWTEALDCMTFFGDAACEGGKLVPTADGICSSEREDYVQCAGSF